MNIQDWPDFIGRIKDSFSVIAEGKAPGDAHEEEIDFIEWQAAPDKQMRAERHRKPKVSHTKTIYSRRIGSQVHEKPVYVEGEEIVFVKVFERKDEDAAWTEAEINS
jgi:hypothetical protein